MSLLLPTVSVTLGPLYATENNDAFGVVDSHNHTSGRGVLIPSAGISIDADLSFASFNATLLRSTRLATNLAPLALITDLGCLYRSGVDLWFNDGNGVQIQLTASGALNAASIGGIGGDYTTSTASVAYSNSTKTFKFLQDTNKSSLLDTGTILLRRTDITSSAAITIKTDTALSSGWTLTLPLAPPASTSLVQIDSSGNLSFSNTPPTLTSLTLTAGLVVGTSVTIGTTLAVTGTIIGSSTITGKHLIGNTSAPAIVIGTAAQGSGGSPSVAISGNDIAGFVTVTTGHTISALSGIIATITFNVAYGSSPKVILTPGNIEANILGQNSRVPFVPVAGQTNGVTTTTFVIQSNSVQSLQGDKTYIWNYMVIQ